MGYNKANYKRIREEYETKYLKVREDADARREELHKEVPGVRELDGKLSGVGLRIMQIALSGEDTQAAIAQLRRENEELLAVRRDLLVRNGFPADYDAPRYECDKCGDTGYVGIRMCECMRRRLNEAGFASSGMSSLMKNQSFENFSMDYYKGSAEEAMRMKINFEAIRRYAQQFAITENSAPENLLFLGGTGLGKTHLSTAVARTVIERGYDVYYNSAVGMISDFEFRRFGSGIASDAGDHTERYTECDLLIIDDLGTEVVNQFTLSCLYHVLNTRLNLQKPTIISTNLSSAELRKTYSDRITSRLMGEYTLIPFYGTDVRKQKLRS